MMKDSGRRLVLALVAVGVSAAGVIVYANSPVAGRHEGAPAHEAKSSPVQQVPAKFVCMANDRVFPNPQIPVKHKGRTYYGCCEGCKKGLRTDERLRLAIDPVSGKTVDKAKAVIGAMPDGTVRYFESNRTMAAFVNAAGGAGRPVIHEAQTN